MLKNIKLIFENYFYQQDYDGELDSMESLYTIERKRMETEYHDWFIDSNELKDRQFKSNGSSSKMVETNASISNSFNKLEID